MAKSLESHKREPNECAEAGFLSRRSHVQVVPGAPKNGTFRASPNKGGAGLSQVCSKTIPEIPEETSVIRHLVTRTGERIAVDVGDFDHLSKFSWCLHSDGYPCRHPSRPYHNGKKSRISLHRQILAAKQGEVVDHRDGNPLNATRANLRITDPLGNARNTVNSKRQKRGQFKGVYLVKKSGRWAALIGAGEKKPDGRSRLIHLGCFDSPREAALAYDRAALSYFGDFAALNFPIAPLAEAANRVGVLTNERVSEASVARKLAEMIGGAK